MRVLINAISAKKGGIVTYTSNLIESLSSRGVEFTVAVPRNFRVDHHVLPLAASEFGPARRLAWEQTAWRATVAQVKPDVLFSSANFGLIGSPVPQVLMVREGGLFDPLYLSTVAPEQGVRVAAMRFLRRWLMLVSARHNDHVITPTQAMRDMLLAWAPELEGRCSVNPYGTLVNIFRPADPPRAWRQDGTLRLLYVSVYYPHKVPGILCQAVERLRRRIPCHAAITMTLDEVKASRGGAYDHFLLSKAQTDGLVTLGGHRYDALPAVYCASDVFVFPSINETFGHPLVEAMSSGLPIIAADTAVNREVCGDVALYYSPHSVEGLCAFIHRLATEPALRARMIETGRKRSLERFGWQAYIDRLLDIFRMVAGQA